MGQRRTMTGTVVSDKTDKTVVVAVPKQKHHRIYKKLIRLTKRYQAHDEENSCKIGDTVLIEETRPLSHSKRWRVVEVVRPGEVPEVAPEAVGANLLSEIAPEAAVEPEEEAEGEEAEE